MDLLEAIVTIAATILAAIGAYFVNAHLQRRFTLTEQLWILKQQHLTELNKEQLKMIDLVKFLSIYRSLMIRSDEMTTLQRARGYEQILNDLSRQCAVQYSELNPMSFDFKAPLGDPRYEIIYNSIVSVIVKEMPEQAQSILKECYEIGLVLDDRSIMEDSRQFVISSAKTIFSADDTGFDLETEWKGLIKKMMEIREKSRKELVRTRASKLEYSENKVVVYGVEVPV